MINYPGGKKIKMTWSLEWIVAEIKREKSGGGPQLRPPALGRRRDPKSLATGERWRSTWRM